MKGEFAKAKDMFESDHPFKVDVFGFSNGIILFRLLPLLGYSDESKFLPIIEFGITYRKPGDDDIRSLWYYDRLKIAMEHYKKEEINFTFGGIKNENNPKQTET